MIDEEKFAQANKNYLEIAKNVTDSLYKICIDTEKEYTGLEIINGISTGVYMFFKSIAKGIGVSTLEIYDTFNRWFNHIHKAIKDNEVQTQESISGSEDKMVGETATKL